MPSFTDLEPSCRTDVPLAEHTWYGLGGAARWFYTPRGEAELCALLARFRTSGMPWRILGRGANVLVRDQGFDGAVIKLVGDAHACIQIDGTLVHAGGGADFTRVVRRSVDHGLGGLENLAGIPGSVGGIIRMNAGGRYGCVAEHVREVRLIGPEGGTETRAARDIDFRYRHTDLGGCVILGATFALRRDDRSELRERFKRIWNEKAAAQPAVSARSAGCIFKNPPGEAAGALLDQAGLKGQRVGGAEISSRHANFIVAHPGARTADVLELIALAKDRVRSKTGIELELEVEVW